MDGLTELERAQRGGATTAPAPKRRRDKTKGGLMKTM